jgi:hypothetical protein
MNKTQHTPGPWIVRQWGLPAGQMTVEVVRGGLRSKVAILHPSHICEEHDGNIQANARLIAAAPDLLAALKECITDDGARCLAYGADTPTLRRRLAAINSVARAALAKAQGEGGAE